MVYSAKSAAVGTISQFTRRKDIKITTGGTSTPANYQVKVTIAYEPGMQATFADIRFNTKIGNAYIDYWIESKTDSNTADVWLELPDAITDPGSDTIWMYYGNAGLSDGGVGNDTFLQWHGVATATYLDSLIVGFSNIIYESRVKSTSDAHNLIWGISNLNPENDDAMFMASYNGDNLRYVYAKNENTPTSLTETPSIVTNQYYKIKATNNGTIVYGYFDGNEIGSGGISTNLPNENMGLYSRIVSGTMEQQWSFVRKYIANEPTSSIGTAQHQRRVSQFM